MCAFLGWLIAWLFVKFMLLQGPDQLEKILNTFPFENMFPAAESEKQFKLLLPLINDQFDYFFKHSLLEKMPMIGMFIGEKTVFQLKSIFIEELNTLFPLVLHQFLNNAKKEFSISLAVKWKPILTPIVFKITKKYRIMAMGIGFVWGIIAALLIHLL
jgi:hypothetical protein